jgi:hypothetical protein
MNLVSRADFSKIAKISRAAVTQMIKRKRLPSNSDGFIDVDYPQVKEYLKARQLKLNPEIKKKNNDIPDKNIKINGSSEEKKSKDIINNAINKEAYEPENEINVDHFEKVIGLTNLKMLSEIRQKETDIKNKILQQKIKRNEYIERDKEGKLIFSYLENLNKRLLNFPVQFIDRIIAISKSSGDEARNKIVELWELEIGKIIKASKNNCLKIFEKENKND